MRRSVSYVKKFPGTGRTSANRQRLDNFRRGDLRAAQQHVSLRRCAETGVTVSAGRRSTAWANICARKSSKLTRAVATSPRCCERAGPKSSSAICRSASQKAAEWYAEQALEAGCAFVNCMPVFIASKPAWRKRFEERGLPIIGDDIKSQVGATIVHRVLTNLFRERGVRLDRTYQLNFGGNTDFLNMLERDGSSRRKSPRRKP